MSVFEVVFVTSTRMDCAGIPLKQTEILKSMSRRQRDLFPELPDGKKYVSDIPELVAEWHPTKNEGKQPKDFSFGSNTKVWWQCDQGHEWQSALWNVLRSMNGKL